MEGMHLTHIHPLIISTIFLTIATASIQIDKSEQPDVAKHDSSILDLVFAIDSTGSMGPYIVSATENIRSIVEEIVASEKSDIRLALVEYRDHPPQEDTFVTRVHDFTGNVMEMRNWLEECRAHGGGDRPEALADALHDVVKLSWRPEATKICILISDAPPHGLDSTGDQFPNGCPNGLDPIKIVHEMAEKKITLYSVGVEPPIVPYREFFMALAYKTGGQYVPLGNAKLLAKVIIGGVREELSLDRLMQDAEEDIIREMREATAEGLDDDGIAMRMTAFFSSRSMRSHRMSNEAGERSAAAEHIYSSCADMDEMKEKYIMTPTEDKIAYASEHLYSSASEAAREMSYDLSTDEEVSVEQSKRIVKKMKSHL